MKIPPHHRHVAAQTNIDPHQAGSDAAGGQDAEAFASTLAAQEGAATTTDGDVQQRLAAARKSLAMDKLDKILQLEQLVASKLPSAQAGSNAAATVDTSVANGNIADQLLGLLAQSTAKNGAAKEAAATKDQGETGAPAEASLTSPQSGQMAPPSSLALSALVAALPAAMTTGTTASLPDQQIKASQSPLAQSSGLLDDASKAAAFPSTMPGARGGAPSSDAGALSKDAAQAVVVSDVALTKQLSSAGAPAAAMQTISAVAPASKTSAGVKSNDNKHALTEAGSHGASAQTLAEVSAGSSSDPSVNGTDPSDAEAQHGSHDQASENAAAPSALEQSRKSATSAETAGSQTQIFKPDAALVAAQPVAGSGARSVSADTASALADGPAPASTAANELPHDPPTAPLARSLTLNLDQPDSGTLKVELHTNGAALDVKLTATDPETYGALDRARLELSDALRGQSYDLNSLVIQDGRTPNASEPRQQPSDPGSFGSDHRSSGNSNSPDRGERNGARPTPQQSKAPGSADTPARGLFV